MSSASGHRAIIAREREAKCMELRLQGYSYRRIGEQVGISEQASWKAVNKVLRRTQKVAEEKAEEIRQIELERLDIMLIGLGTKLTTGDPKAVMAAVAIGKRRSELLGLDAPKKIEVEDVTDIDRQIDELLAKHPTRVQTVDGRVEYSREISPPVEVNGTGQSIDSAGAVVQLALPSGERMGEDSHRC